MLVSPVATRPGGESLRFLSLEGPEGARGEVRFTSVVIHSVFNHSFIQQTFVA